MLMREGRIGPMVLRHRLITGPMERSLANRDGSLTARYIDYLTERAKGGASLIQVESTYVDTRGMGHLYQVGAHDDHVIPALKRATEAVHAHGAKIGLEIYMGGRQTPAYVSQRQPIAPSVVMCRALHPHPTPREMTQADINDVIGQYCRAAERAVRTGMDMIHMHGAHGYLLCGFLSPFSNHRTDKYGGSAENRARFALELMAELRKTVGMKVAIGYRLTAEEFIDGGLTIQDTIEFSKRLADVGIDLIDVSGGIYESFQMIIQGPESPKGGFVRNAAAIKKAVGNTVPVSVAQRLNDPEFANEVMRREGIDFISLTRAFHADPHFARKVKENRTQDILPCMACHQCTNLLEKNVAAECAANPHSTHERDRRIVSVSRPRHVMIVGGGPAGMHAARILRRQGNRVSLFERTGELGGQIRYSGRIAADYLNLIHYLSHQVNKLGVEVHLETTVDLDLISSIDPEVVVVAAGALGGLSWCPIVGNAKTFDIFSAMDRPEGEWTGQAAIIGGDSESCFVALYLAQQGVEVFIIEPKEGFADNKLSPGRDLLLMEVKKFPAIHLISQTTAEEVGPGYVLTQSGGRIERLEGIDSIIFGERVANNAIYEQLLAAQPQREAYNIGDSVTPRDMYWASSEAADVAERIRLRSAAASHP
jgi:2,4-dienoyl-CoA reductase-like NADH-dependent reductase (Old Yellow Enzyme family)/thioredoxin reductase